MEPPRKETTQDDPSPSLSLSLGSKETRKANHGACFRRRKEKREFRGPETSNEFIYEKNRQRGGACCMSFFSFLFSFLFFRVWF
jgi:hypothetical protein